VVTIDYRPVAAPCLRCHLDQLQFLPFAELEQGGEYDEKLPKYVCYTIGWKFIPNRKAVGRVTEEGLVVAPPMWW
jgi:hypothetical protein